MKYLLMILALFVVGCERDQAILKETETENGWAVQLLFQHEDYKIYRFWDGGYRYFIIPEGKVMKITAGDGDDSERIEEISTMR